MKRVTHIFVWVRRNPRRLVSDHQALHCLRCYRLQKQVEFHTISTYLIIPIIKLWQKMQTFQPTSNFFRGRLMSRIFNHNRRHFHSDSDRDLQNQLCTSFYYQPRSGRSSRSVGRKRKKRTYGFFIIVTFVFCVFWYFY